MRKILLQIVKKTAGILHWKWLYFIAGIALLGGIESCESTTPMCYDPVVPIDTTTVDTTQRTYNVQDKFEPAETEEALINQTLR